MRGIMGYMDWPGTPLSSLNPLLTSLPSPLRQVTRLEVSRRFLLTSSRPLTDAEKAAFAGLVHDRMTEEVYHKPAATFK